MVSPSIRTAICTSARWPIPCGRRLFPILPCPIRYALCRSWRKRLRRADAPLQHLAGIHQVVRVERSLDTAHQVELERALVAAHLAHLLLADAVLGAEAAVEAGDQIMDDGVHLFCA